MLHAGASAKLAAMFRFFPATLLAGLLAGCATAGGEPDSGPGDHADAAQLADAARFADARPGTPDAAPGTPDAMPGTPDAMPSPPDAMPSLPDAMGCTVQTVNLLGNGNFDSGAVTWVTQGSPDYYDVILSTSSSPDPFPKTPYSGVWGAWLGGAYGPDISTNEIMYVYQDVAVPAGATGLSISGQRWFESSDFGNYDQSAVEIWNTSNTFLQSVALWNADDVTTAWTAFSAATNNYAGQTVRVVLISSNDWIDNTNFFYDSVSFNATVCL